MSRNKIIILALVGILLILTGGFAWIRVKAVFQQQLAPAIVLQDQATPTVPVAPAPAPTATAQAKTCGQSGVMTFLVLANNTYYGTTDSGADFVRFMRVDFDKQTVGFTAIPDDIWVATPHLAALNLDHSRLGLIYVAMQQASSGTKAQIATAATQAVAQALIDNYGVSADHYITFDARYFVDVVDQVGGLDLNVPGDVTDGIHTFKPGQQHMNGDAAFQYARVLTGGIELIGGWDRIDRQNQVLKALIGKMLEPANLVKVPGLIQQFRDDVTTDLSPELIPDLTCMAGKVPQSQISTAEVEAPWILGEGPNDSMLADTEKVKTFLQQQLAR